MLWRSRSDGTDALQLTYPPMEAYEPYISPDGTKVVFDNVWAHTLCVVDMNGGPPKTIAENASDARWSPDGRSIVADFQTEDGARAGISVVEVATGKKSEISSGNDNVAAFWLDQNTLVAVNDPEGKLVLFD
jgi:Tol biopolymer transport system component